MKKIWYKKLWSWVIAGISLIIMISTPFIINWAYLKGAENDTINTAFSASDMLALYGSVIGGLISLSGIVVAIIHFKKQQKADTKRMNEQRIRDKNADRMAYVSKHLENTLYILDVTPWFHFMIDYANPFSSINEIRVYISEIHRILAIEMIFAKEQKDILAEAIFKLIKYTNEYSELTIKWAEACGKLGNRKYYQTTLQLKDSLMKYPEQNTDEIKHLQGILDNMEDQSSDEIIRQMKDKMNDMVCYYNENYIPLQTAINTGLAELERYYENQAIETEE